MRRSFIAIITVIAMSSVIVGCGGKSAFELAVGDCFDDPTSFEEVSEVPEKACSEAHDNEVFANRDMPDSTWPGDVAVQDWADEACLEEFEPYVGASYDASSLEFGWLVPTEESWNEIGDRTVTCILYDVNLEKLTGSVKGTGV